MSRAKLAKRLGIVVAATVVAGFLGARLAGSAIPQLSFLQKGQLVYSERKASTYPGLSATATFMNVPVNYKDAVDQVSKEMPSAVERNDGEEGPYFLVPQMAGGRVQLSEFPEQKIAIKPGKLMRVGARMMVMVGTGDDWSHIEIQDFRQPSALESAFNWVGDKLGI